MSKVATIVCWAVLCCSAWAQSPGSSESRTWKDRSGKELVARLVRYREGIVYLRDHSRQTAKVHPAQLSDADQKYILDLLRAEGKEDQADEFEGLTKSLPAFSGNGSENAATPGTPSGYNPSGGRRPGFNRGSGFIPGGGFPSTNIEAPFTSDPDAREGGVTPESNLAPPKSDKDIFGNSTETQPEIKSRVREPDVDPFADLRPPAANRNDESSVHTSSSAPTDRQRQMTEEGYRPPMLENKLDDTTASSTAISRTDAGPEKGEFSQSLILIVLAVVGILLLVMIALLIMVLVKSRSPQPGRGYYY